MNLGCYFLDRRHCDRRPLNMRFPISESGVGKRDKRPQKKRMRRKSGPMTSVTGVFACRNLGSCRNFIILCHSQSHNLQPDSVIETVFTPLHYHKIWHPSIEPASHCLNFSSPYFALRISASPLQLLTSIFYFRYSASSLCTHDKPSGCGAALPPAQADAN